MMARHVDGFFVQGVGHGAVDLVGVGKLDDPFHVLEGCFARLHAHLTDGQGIGVHQLHIIHVDGAGGEERVFHVGNGMNDDFLMAYDLLGLFQHTGVAHYQGTALLVYVGPGQGLHGDFRADGGRVAHGDA